MPINYPDVLDVRRSAEVGWSERETMLYALGLGLGDDPMDSSELRFVTEVDDGPIALPTMAAILTAQASPISLTGANQLLSVHGAQSIRLHRPLPAHGTGRVDSRIIDVYDKGEGKGAVLLSETTLRDQTSGELIATAASTAFARGDGGFGGRTDPVPAPAPVPARPADRTVEIATRAGQALLYRLSGDFNPIHSDPIVSARAGFARPILHGLCTYGIAGWAVLKAFCDSDPAQLRSHSVRFSAPVLPGDTIRLDLWRDGDVVAFEATVPKRGVVVLKNGRAELG